MHRLYAWGANSHGQLGLGFQSELLADPCEIHFDSPSGAGAECIKKIVGGAGHTLILDDAGRIYSCGWNDRGQTGLGLDGQKVIFKFREIGRLDNEPVKDIACGWNSSVALTESGQVYVWGSNSHGQLGIRSSKDFQDFREPTKLDYLPEAIKSVSMGLRHCALVTESGKVLVSGSGAKSQLGILNADDSAVRDIETFTQIAGLSDVLEAACGQNHTAALSKSGEIFTWGDNRYGQCGFDSVLKNRIDFPARVESEDLAKCWQIRVGWTHTSVLRTDGTMIAWGRNNYGQLGHRDQEIHSSWSPKLIRTVSKMRQLAIGSEHNVAIDENRSVFSWGWNEHGNCGDGSTSNVFEPKRLDFPHEGEAVLVGSGAGHSFAVIIDKT